MGQLAAQGKIQYKYILHTEQVWFVATDGTGIKQAFKTKILYNCPMVIIDPLKFGYSEKATKFEKIFKLQVDFFFQILWPSQNIRTLLLSVSLFC